MPERPSGYSLAVATRLHAGASGIGLLALGLGLSACGGSQDAAVTEVAHEFSAAVSDGDGATACNLLAPSTRTELEQSTGKACDRALLEELGGTPVAAGDLHVYGLMAEVADDRGAVFLTRMPDGWHVLAAGCSPRPDAPYDCAVEGG